MLLALRILETSLPETPDSLKSFEMVMFLAWNPAAKAAKVALPRVP